MTQDSSSGVPLEAPHVTSPYHGLSVYPQQRGMISVSLPLAQAGAASGYAWSSGNPSLTGRFGRLVPIIEHRAMNPENLFELADSLRDDAAPAGDNPNIPAGYTYLGQFIDHDMTFDTTSVPEQRVDPQTVWNFRTPKLDLDCVYGLGPAASPFLYQRDDRKKFLLGVVGAGGGLAREKLVLPDGGRYDVPRNAEGFALVGDPRNDQNLVVSQFHVALMKFHNAIADEYSGDRGSPAEVFYEIRRQVTRHYQSIVVNDFLRHVADPAVVDDVLQNGRRLYRFGTDPFIPIEFSVAAFRFGHSMVRESYDYNRFFGPAGDQLGQATLQRLFAFTGPQRPTSFFGTVVPSTPVPAEWIIDWRRFFDLGERYRPNASRLINTRISATLHDLPIGVVATGPFSLPRRTLQRGLAVTLPTGQVLANRAQIPSLTPLEISEHGADGEIAGRHGLHLETPLWYYLLKEAELRAAGKRLGPLGSRIVAEVLIGLLQGDPESYMNARSGWKPAIPIADANRGLTVADLLRYVDRKTPIINPLGGRSLGKPGGLPSSVQSD